VKAPVSDASERAGRKLRRNPCRASLLVGGAVASLVYARGLQAHPSEYDIARPTANGSAPSAARPWSFFGGYTSHELSNPGLHLGAEYALSATPHFQSLVTGSFQAYDQPEIETGYALHARWGHRYTASFGFTFDSYLGIGAQLTRYDTTVFEFENDVAIADERSESLVAFSPHVVFGPGYDFERLLAVPLHLYARPGVTLVYPDLNDAFQASVIVEIGLRWTPKGRARN
jgi:hypothetical protein